MPRDRDENRGFPQPFAGWIGESPALWVSRDTVYVSPDSVELNRVASSRRHRARRRKLFEPLPDALKLGAVPAPA